MAPHSHSALLHLIDALYAAPGSQDGWMAFLRKLGDSVQAAGVHFIAVSNTHRANISITTVDNAEALAEYQAYWGARDPWGQSARLHASPSQSVILGQEIVPHSALVRTDYYAGFARRYDLTRAAIGVVERSADGVSVLSINRAERQAEFDAPEAELLRALMPHLQRSVQLHTRLVSSENRSQVLTGLVAGTAHAVCLIDARGRLTFMNDAATRLLASRDGIALDRGELRASDQSAATALRRAIADAARTTTGEGSGAGAAVQLPRPSGKRPLIAIVSPLSRAHRRGMLPDAERAAALIVIGDPHAAPAPSAELLRVVFRLTPAEARLAQLLAACRSPTLRVSLECPSSRCASSSGACSRKRTPRDKQSLSRC